MIKQNTNLFFCTFSKEIFFKIKNAHFYLKFIRKKINQNNGKNNKSLFDCEFYKTLLP